MNKYDLVRVAAVSPELRVADVDFNKTKIIEAMYLAANNNATHILFPELCITGYTCADLFFQSTLRRDAISALMEIVEATAKLGLLVIVGLPIESESKLFNCAAVVFSGDVLGLVPKQYLPNSREFYEKRWFASGVKKSSSIYLPGNIEVPLSDRLLFCSGDFTFGIEICEDLWSPIPPSSYQAISGAQVIFNLSASNELIGKAHYRRSLVQQQSARTVGAYVYASAGSCESSTDLVFSGHSLIGENGQILSESPRFKFETQTIYADIDIGKLTFERILSSSFGDSYCADRQFSKIFYKGKSSDEVLVSQPIGSMRINPPHPFVPTDPKMRQEVCTEIFLIQATGLAKRIKHTGIKNIVLGISGGLDSTLAFLVALKAFEILGLDKSGIQAITMPGFGTSERTRLNAEDLINKTGASLRIISIENSVSIHFKDIGHDPNVHDITFENAQARERTQILMDIANQCNGLVVGTGDLSESALGWCTFNGDQISMYHVNSGIPKTLVKYLVGWCAQEMFDGAVRKILIDICETPVSPELLPLNADGTINQQTEEVVGPYELHDYFLYSAIRCGYSPRKIIYMANLAFEGRYPSSELIKWLRIFIIRFFSQQFKRSNMPDGPKVGSVALSPRGDWRMPSDACPNLWLKELDEIELFL
jgi:NAD+ synthase (glutamine-hydrolysing)